MSVLNAYDIHNILFLDIETVPVVADFEALSEEMQELWGRRCQRLVSRPEGEIEYEEMAALFSERAGIFAEFGRIVCISAGFLTRDPAGSDRSLLRIKSFANTMESALLEDFSEMLSKHFNNPDKFALCGHNIREFDIPYICRRMMVNQLPMPRMLDISGRKPWETRHLLDTLEMWKFGDMKNFTSLRMLTALFDIPSPKDDIDGSDVARVFWEDRDLDRIATYCEKDVLATTQLFLRFKRMPLLESDQVVSVR
jgi:hypothetical protein